MDLETAARKRREKAGGKERVHESGLAIVRNTEDRRMADKLSAKVALWRNEAPIEETVEADRHVPSNAIGGATRAEREAWSRSILDACED